MAEDERTETLQAQHNPAKLRILHPSHEHGDERTDYGEGGGGSEGEEIPGGSVTLDPSTVAAGPADTVVGTLAATVSGTPTFSLLDDSSGAFKVAGDQLLMARDLIGFVEHPVTIKAVGSDGWCQSDIVITVEA